VMAPSQVVEPKDLPPEVLSATSNVIKATSLATPPEFAMEAAELQGAAGVGASMPASSAVVLLPATPDLLVHSSVNQAQAVAVAALSASWETGLEAEAMALLATGRSDVWDVLTRRFESKLIQTALLNTRGRRIEAAQKLGIGRNTITRKIQELNLE
jgi:two-component system, NtrC family, nitrogen regulation response regulator GlnG